MQWRGTGAATATAILSLLGEQTAIRSRAFARRFARLAPQRACTAPMSNALVGAIVVEDGTHSLRMVFRHEGIGTPIRRLARIRPCVPRIHRPTAAGRSDPDKRCDFRWNDAGH